MKQIDQIRRRAARYLDIDAVTIAPARGVFSLSFDDIPATAWTEAGPIQQLQLEPTRLTQPRDGWCAKHRLH